MTLRGLGSSTGTAPDHSNHTKPGVEKGNVRTPSKLSDNKKLSSNRSTQKYPVGEIEKTPYSLRSQGVFNYENGSWDKSTGIDDEKAPIRTRSRNVDAIQSEENRSKKDFSKSIAQASKKSSERSSKKSSEHNKSRPTPESGLRESKKSSRSTTKKGKSDSRKTATSKPRTKSGVMVVNERIARSGIPDIHGLERKFNGRVFGCVFFMGKSQTPAEHNKTSKRDKLAVQKEVQKKHRDVAKGKKGRNASGKTKVEERTKGEKRRVKERKAEKRVKERKIEERKVEERKISKDSKKTETTCAGIRGSQVANSLEAVRERLRKSEKVENGSDSFSVKASPGSSSKGERKTHDRSGDKKRRSLEEKTLCRVEISGKEKDTIPTLVVKVCAKKSK